MNGKCPSAYSDKMLKFQVVTAYGNAFVSNERCKRKTISIGTFYSSNYLLNKLILSHRSVKSSADGFITTMAEDLPCVAFISLQIM